MEERWELGDPVKGDVESDECLTQEVEVLGELCERVVVKDECCETSYLHNRGRDGLESIGGAIEHLELRESRYLGGERGELVAVEVEEGELFQASHLGGEGLQVVVRQHELSQLRETVERGGEVCEVGLAKVHHRDGRLGLHADVTDVVGLRHRFLEF